MGETVDSVAGSQASPADQSSGPGRWSKKPMGSLIRVVPRLFLWIAVAEGVLVAVVMAVAVAGITVSVIMAVTDTRPSLIDDLRAGRVTSRDVTSAAILKFDPARRGGQGARKATRRRPDTDCDQPSGPPYFDCWQCQRPMGALQGTTRKASTTASC